MHSTKNKLMKLPNRERAPLKRISISKVEDHEIRIRDFESVKEAKRVAIAQLEYYNRMMKTPERLSWDETWMQMAEVLAQRSSAVKRKVGAIAVRNNDIIAIGYNGTAPGTDNTCEDEYNKTDHTRVYHAEENIRYKLEQDECIADATLYVTTAPCLKCAKKILYDNIFCRVVYREDYKNDDGIKYLYPWVRVSKLEGKCIED